MKIREFLRQYLIQGLVTGIIGALGWSLAAIVKEVSSPLLIYVVPSISKLALLWLCLILFLICILLSVWVGFLTYGDKWKRIKKQYHFDTRGFYVHQKSGAFVCGNCFTKSVESPLALQGLSDHGQYIDVWRCQINECKDIWPATGDEVKKHDLA